MRMIAPDARQAGGLVAYCRFSKTDISVGPELAGLDLARPGTPIFGPRGFTGTVTSSHGWHATVAPTGGGAPGILIPRSRSTGTLFLPGRPPVTVIMHP